MLSVSKEKSKYVPAYRLKIGNREVVGPGWNGLEEYYDKPDHPCPAIRWKPPSPEFSALQAKERGDWKAMTVAEKKQLYRLNYCQTIKEIRAPTAHGRYIFGKALCLACIPLLAFTCLTMTLFPPPPESLSDQAKKQLVRYYIDANVDPMDGGISSKWDYEKQQWKERPYLLMRSK